MAKNTYRPAIGLDSLKPVKYLSPAHFEHSLSFMIYGLTNYSVLGQTYENSNQSSLINTHNCRPAVEAKIP